jgi:hypothetical protein
MHIPEAQILEMVRVVVSQAGGDVSLPEVLDQLGLSGDIRKRIQDEIEAELGVEIVVGEGIGGWEAGPWIDERDVDWFHWHRLTRLWTKKGRMPAGAIRTIDKTSKVILDKMPPPDLADFDWHGMIVGNVQSGKTAAFTALISKAADAGYQLFVVLSGLLNSLRLQTQLRLSAEVLGNPSLGGDPMPPGRVWHPLTKERLDGDFFIPGGMGVDLLQAGQTPTIAVMKKNVPVMERFNIWLEDIQLRNPDLVRGLPVLVIDDEADEASIDTSNTDEPSSTNRELRRLLGHFSRTAYLGFTATPYANCFIPHRKEDPRLGKDLYPKDYVLPLQTSSEYFGSEKVFGRDSVWEGEPTEPLCGELFREIPLEEVASLIPPARDADEFTPAMTDTFREAIYSYLLAGAARQQRGQGDSPCTMLVHISQRTKQHQHQARLVKEVVDDAYGKLLGGNGREAFLDELRVIWERSFMPTTRALSSRYCCDFDEIIEHLESFVQSPVEILTINQDSDDVVDFVRNPDLKAIVIGGQNLGRGLTLEDLVCTFFLRRSGNQSTAMQMQRWCGYRGAVLDLIRVYTTEDIREQYREFLAIEQEMRDELRKYEREHIRPDEIGMRLRQHPDVPLVSTAKLGAQRTVAGQYSGKLAQTTTFPLENLGLLADNEAATKDFVSRLSGNKDIETVDGPPGRAVWLRVPAIAVIEYLREFDYPRHGGRTSFGTDSIIRYIEEKTSSGTGLTSWTVAVLGQQQASEKAGTVDLGWTEPFNRRERGLADPEKSRNRIGIITEPDHEGIGLEAGLSGLNARAERDADNGLLLVYPIVSPIDVREEGPTLIGLAISFPSSLEDRGDIVAGSAPLEAELDDLEE